MSLTKTKGAEGETNHVSGSRFSAVSLAQQHLLVMWSTAFYLLERYADEISDQEFKSSILKVFPKTLRKCVGVMVRQFPEILVVSSWRWGRVPLQIWHDTSFIFKPILDQCCPMLPISDQHGFIVNSSFKCWNLNLNIPLFIATLFLLGTIVHVLLFPWMNECEFVTWPSERCPRCVLQRREHPAQYLPRRHEGPGATRGFLRSVEFPVRLTRQTQRGQVSEGLKSTAVARLLSTSWSVCCYCVCSL